jgi:hypothetical protein
MLSFLRRVRVTIEHTEYTLLNAQLRLKYKYSITINHYKNVGPYFYLVLRHLIILTEKVCVNFLLGIRTYTMQVTFHCTAYSVQLQHNFSC